MKARLIVAGIIIITAAIALASIQARKPVAAPEQTRARAGVSTVVVAAGRVEPVSEEIEISSELNGKLEAVLVEEGDRVRRGQVIARLENADYVARAAYSEALVAQREAALERALNGSREEDRREAEAGVVEVRAVLENARAEVARRRDLFGSGDISRADLDRFERELSVAQARYDAAVQRRDRTEQATRKEDLAAARAEGAQARAQLAEARALLDKTIIRSPITGVVLRKHCQTGESVSNERKNPIVTVADDSSLRVRVDLDEADVARVKVGQGAWVTAEAYGDRRFWGRVVRIGQILGRKNVRTEEPTERVDTKILETLVDLDPGQRLPAGLRVDAFIEVSR